MKECLFCKMIKGEVPTNTIYEDDKIKVFLDINPVTNGHMLVIQRPIMKQLWIWTHLPLVIWQKSFKKSYILYYKKN